LPGVPNKPINGITSQCHFGPGT